MRHISPSTVLIGSLVYFTNHLNILNPYVEVDINQGRLRGTRTVSRNGRPYMEFIGIPYAKPPIGNLRFEPPEPPDDWTGVRLATVYGRSCLQYEFLTHVFTGSEDCLTLNVYTHQVLASNQIKSATLKPVVVYIFGGLFMSGFSYVYRGKYFLDEDVVLVTFNYRVNSFGFLNTGDEVIRGNMGLKDQVMVLKWVQQNIVYFGGDPNLVTVMGQSAGAASAHYHLLSNMSKGLFHRVISQSGTALQPWALSRTPKQQAQHLGNALKCPTDNSRALANCLKSRNALAITMFHKEYLDPIPNPLTLYGPSVEFMNDENAFLTESPIEILRSGRVASKVPWIVGATSGEGLLGAGYLTKRPKELLALDKEWSKYAPILFGYHNRPDTSNISSKIRNRYFQDEEINVKNFKKIANLYSDSTMYSGMQESVRLHSKVAPVYPYIFSYEGDSGLTNILLRMVGGLPRLVDFLIGTTRRWIAGKLCRNCIQNTGVSHADELVYQFNIPVITDEITPGSEDYPFSSAFMKLWISFVNDGKPSDFLGINWTQIQPNHLELHFLKLDEPPAIVIEPFKNISEFWRSLNLSGFN